jgi:hypothetical protein
VAAAGDTSKMPPPLPAPALPVFVALAPVEDPPEALKTAELPPVPMLIVPDALISNAPPPAPAVLPLPFAALPPEQPPRRGRRLVLALAAPPAAPLVPFESAP